MSASDLFCYHRIPMVCFSPHGPHRTQNRWYSACFTRNTRGLKVMRDKIVTAIWEPAYLFALQDLARNSRPGGVQRCWCALWRWMQFFCQQYLCNILVQRVFLRGRYILYSTSNGRGSTLAPGKSDFDKLCTTLAPVDQVADSNYLLLWYQMIW